MLFVNGALDDYPLTLEEFRIYAHLARRAGSGTAYPSIDSMARTCRMNPDTARRCVHNLLTYGMLEANERRGMTTLYRLTRFSRWAGPEEVLAVQKRQAQAGKARRAEKKALKEINAADLSEMRGGVLDAISVLPSLKQGEEDPCEMRGGHPSQTRGGEVNPSRDSIEGHPSSGDAPEDAEDRLRSWDAS